MAAKAPSSTCFRPPPGSPSQPRYGTFAQSGRFVVRAFRTPSAMESFWATLKAELRITKPFITKQQARLAIFDYIETFYNRRRLHSAVGYKAPMDVEAELKADTIIPEVSAIPG